MTDEVRTTFGGAAVNADAVVVAGNSASAPMFNQAIGDRQTVVQGTLTLGASYSVNQCMGGILTIAAGIGNSTPFAISAIETTFLTGGSLPAGPGGILIVSGTALTGTYTDAATMVVSSADQLAMIRASNFAANGGASGTFSAVTTAAYKGLGSGVTSAAGNIYVALLSTTAFTFTGGATLLVRLTIHY